MRDFVIPSSANYTEFLRDYLKNNELPASLNDADVAFDCNFKNVFTNYYLMREIGFDTEEMFKQKLNSQIDIMLPYYIDKATKLKLLFTNIFENGYSITQTNNLAEAETETTARDVNDKKVLDRTEHADGSNDTTQTNNLKQEIDEDADGKEVNYKTPLGSQNDNLPYNAIEGGKTIHNEKDNVQTNTGTIATENDTENDVDIDETTTGTIDEDITRSKSGTNTGTITTLYSKNPRFNSLEALTKFQDDFRNIIQECLSSFECLFMQIF